MSNNIFFTSAKNYMKQDASSGSANIAAPVTSAYSGYIFVTNYIVNHNLGYVPMYRVYYEPFKDGVIWPVLGTRFDEEAFNPQNTALTGPGLFAYATSTQLNIQIYYINNTLTGTYPIYWVIYKDYVV